ncbi:Fibronectin type III domain [Popillia japonica]|uniref:Fibronectin type III domain n=1 Tax=Popillia japonica TaxID=7064 RepID=A0AAW1ITS1_POPJA
MNFETAEYLNNTTDTTNSVNHETFNTAPYNLKAEYISSSSINISWTHNNKHVDSFVICQVLLDSSKNNCQTVDSKSNKFTFENLQPSTIYEFRNLQPSTIYEFRVRAKFANNNFSLNSRAIEACTLPEVLGPPTIQDLKYRVLNATSVCLQWRAPHTINGTKIKYFVSYKNSSDGVVGKKIDINTSQHCWIPPPSGKNVFQAQLTQLNPELKYTVSITLENTSNSYSIFVSTRKINNTVEKVEDEIYEQQKLGFILGIAISLFGVASCVSCLVYSMKRRQNTNTAPQLRANYYNGGAHATTTFASLQVRHQEACAADVQEIQTLIGENGVCHIPSATPNDLDTKGGITFPNQQANGSIHHPAKTVYIPNGHVHITENPQFYIHSQNQNNHPEREPILQSTQDDSFEEDSNSNLQNTKLRKFFFQTPPDQSEKRKSGSPVNLNESVSSSIDSSLNVTQMTILDTSGVLYRKVSAPLGPNG